MKFEFPKKLNLANLPTPIQQVRGLSEKLGREVYIKRDDLTGCATSGNKIRKLEYVLAEAKEQGAQVVITIGGIQSNHCRTTVVACREVGLEPYLILRGEQAGPPEGNLFLNMLCGAGVRYITLEEYKQNLDAVIEEIVSEQAKQGKKCYYCPVGASTPLGAMGYLECAREISQWQQDNNMTFDRIYYAAGSGGTSAGLIMGKKLYNIGARVRGINVGEPRDEFVAKTEEIMRGAIERFGVGVGFSREDIEIIEGYYGAGYGDVPDEAAALIRECAVSDGLMLDPVYTAKGMLGLIGEERKLEGGSGEKILFIHTGGIFSLFAFKQRLLEGSAC